MGMNLSDKIVYYENGDKKMIMTVKMNEEKSDK